MGKKNYIKALETFEKARNTFEALRESGVRHVTFLGISNSNLQDGNVKTTQDFTFTHNSNVDVGLLHFDDIGELFVIGSLSPLLMENIGQKALGALSGDITDVFAGLGLTDKKAFKLKNDLANGLYLLIAREKYDPESNTTKSIQQYFEL